jgi:peptidoglycan/xylan/chitin deacetylase (PgdA/CDA1 family)
METSSESSDDDGDPATASAQRRSMKLARILLLLSALFICIQPKSRPRNSATIPTSKPLAAVPSKKEKPRKATTPQPHRARKKLYITFDDGPNRGTHNVWTIVRDEQVAVSFFLVGEHVFDSPAQQAMYDSLKATPNIALCNHSYSHAHCRYQHYYQTPDSVVADFRRTRDSLGLANDIARTPGRNIWRIDSLRCTDLKASAAAADSLQNAGFALMGWDAEWTFDHKTYNVEQDACTLMQQIDSLFARKRLQHPDHLVLLAHDQAFVKSSDSLQLRLFLQELKKRGDIELVVATDYPGMK